MSNEPIVNRALSAPPNQGSGGQPPKSPFDRVLDALEALGTRLLLLEARPLARDGRDGVAGPGGAIGPQGERGPQGPQGVAGDRGPQGERGPPGPRGERGDRGEPGSAGTLISIGESYPADIDAKSLRNLLCRDVTVVDRDGNEFTFQALTRN